ncbi:unnamed protein product [Rotaria sp. Silwood1]|nr:unnamed protein product [Rotaria sp. Silwood1]
MASTVDELKLSTSNLVQNVQSEEQTTKNVILTEPPSYESCLTNTNTSHQVHYQSQLGSRDNDQCTQAFIGVRPTFPNQSIDQIETYIVWSIFNILCCCLCFGCVACCYPNKTQRLKGRNDFQGALKASKQARTWNSIATIFGICNLIFGVVFEILKESL